MSQETQEFIEIFRQEAFEHLNTIEETALNIEKNPDDEESINRLFRAIHSIKGSGSMFGYNEIAGFAHHLETMLDQVRTGMLPVSNELINLVLQSRDQIKVMLADPDEKPGEHCDRIVKALQNLTSPQSEILDSRSENLFRVQFKPDADIITSGMDPALLLEELCELGTCEISIHSGEVPLLAKLKPQKCFLSWDIIISTQHNLNAIQDVFIFLDQNSQVRIQDNIEVALAEQPLIQKRLNTTASDSVRISSDKLDHLINLVGELVIAQDRLGQSAACINQDDQKKYLTGSVEEIERLTDDLRECALNMRMVPLETCFNKFRRLVRDLSQELGKEVELVIEGGETELDKNLIEQLNDPLTHLIRNSIDHGIGTPEKRKKKGKPARGIVRICAAHQGAKVMISISDDGQGLDADSIRAKAIAKGLVAEDVVLSEDDLFAFIFAPGFSTTDQVSDVSGRGVGMDVVKKNINSLGGAVRITSKKEQGVCFDLSIPLTLAIIDGLLVKVAGLSFVLPLEQVEECEEIKPSRFAKNNRNMIRVRNEWIPFVRLREIFKYPGNHPSIEQMAIVEFENDRIGILADEIAGNIKAVKKPLDRLLRNAAGIAGATIMGDGFVVLIIDIPGLIQWARHYVS